MVAEPTYVFPTSIAAFGVLFAVVSGKVCEGFVAKCEGRACKILVGNGGSGKSALHVELMPAELALMSLSVPFHLAAIATEQLLVASQLVVVVTVMMSSLNNRHVS